MKHIAIGITLGCFVVPVATVIFSIITWFAYGLNKFELGFIDTLIYGASTGVVGILFALIFLLIYGLPLFLILRHFNRANMRAVVIAAILPWVIVDGFMNQDLHHFFEFTWYSLVCALTFWFFARKSIGSKVNNV